MIDYFGVILSASMLSLLLSFVLVGPVFFLLIEVSLNKGIKAALALDIGVICADLVFISICYYGSKDVSKYLQNYPQTFAIGGLIIFIFGLFQFLSKGNLHYKNKINLGKNYLITFFKGFLLNFVNMGIFVFWLATVVIVNARYHNDNYKIVLFFATLLGVFLGIDLLKILLARRFKMYFTDQNIYKMKKIVGVIMAIIGIYLILKSFNPLNLDKEIENNPLQKIR